MEKFKWCANRFFSTFGKVSALITIFVSFVTILSQDQIPQELLIDFLKLMFDTLAIMLVTLIPATFFELILLKSGPYESSLWIRRMAFMVLYGITFASVVAIFGLVEFDSGVKLALYFLEMILLFFVLGMTNFLIRDARQKKNIEQINEKLNELNQE
ncbi:MAG: hypothetical protein IKK74_08110 [Clostridia bacterium]|nr:hypothetical protein [Clostridia bacterium]